MARAHDLAFLDAQCLCLLAVAGWAEGDLGRAAEEAAAGLHAAATHGWRASPWTGWAAAAAAHVDLLRGRPLQALALCADALAVGPEQPALRATLRGLHGAAMFDAGDRVPGLDELHHARVELSGLAAPAAVCAAAALLEQQAALELGHTTAAAGALGWLATRGVAPAELALGHARAEAAAGSPDVARRIVGTVLDGRAGRPVLPTTLVEAWLLEASGACAADDRSATRRALREAVAIAEARHAVRPFVVVDDSVGELLVDLLGCMDDATGFAARVLAVHTPAASVTVMLSTRETRRPHQALLAGQPRRDRRRDGGLGEHGQDASACHLRQAGCQRPPRGSTGGARAGTARMTPTC